MEHTPKPMSIPTKEPAMKRSAVWIMAGVFLFVFGWRACVMATRFFNRQTIIRELASIPQFVQDVNPNRANTRLVFCQDTEDGVGIYFCDTAGGKPRLLCEQKEKGCRGWRFTMLGWAPDDKLFACAFPDNKTPQQLILIFDGLTGEPVGKVVTDPRVYNFGWLSPSSFAYASRNFVRVVTRQAKGYWAYNKNFENVAANMDNFTAISDNAVAWRDGDGIWLFNLASGSSEEIWEAAADPLVEFTWARDAKELLLNCSDEAGQYLLRFNPDDKRTFDLGRIGSQQDYIRKASWNGQGTSYACLTNDWAGSAFCVKTAEMETPMIIPWQGGVRSFTLNGDKLFFSGNPDDEPPSIWECDVKSKEFKCIVASTGGPLKYSLRSPTSCEAMTNSLGEQRFYHLWAPRDVSPNQKYPLLLAQELNTWFPCFQVAAHSGYYVAVVDRPFFHTWNGAHERTWVEDVSSLHEIMAQNPNIDTTRVYLYACSAETYYLSQLLRDRPTLAKGAILFSPSALPDFSLLQNKRLLIVDGTADGNATQRLPEFQSRAAQDGGAVTLFFEDDSGHMAASGATERKRAMQFASFLSNTR